MLTRTHYPLATCALKNSTLTTGATYLVSVSSTRVDFSRFPPVERLYRYRCSVCSLDIILTVLVCPIRTQLATFSSEKFLVSEVFR